MDGVSTITTRGQVVIPQPIRDFFGLKPSDKLSFEIEEDKIIARPIISLDEAFGMFKAKRKLPKREYKKVIFKQVVKKFKKR
jgi:AbrB family looped-hinge helix DNA binding protein